MGVLLGAIACQSVSEPTLSATSIARRLSVGETTTCALDVDGTVYCWGQNGNQWQYGVSPTIQPSSTTPVAVPVPKLISISAGVGQHTCGITSLLSGVCWGRGGFGQLGGGSIGAAGNAATTISGSVQWADIIVSRLSTCGLSADRTPYCWGSNQSGEIGVDTIPIDSVTRTPTATASIFPFTSIAPGWIHACGIVSGGKVYCWGDNEYGQLAIGSVDGGHHREANPVVGSDRFIQLSSGSLYTCGITVDHYAMCWGDNSTGQLGNGTTEPTSAPIAVAGNLRFRYIAAGSGFAGGSTATLPAGAVSAAHTCALTDDGTPYCWGFNPAGEVGDGTTTDRLSPTLVSGGLHLSIIGLGGTHTCGMSGSAIWCWGSNLRGQLGNGTNVDSPVPVQVQAPFAKP